MTGIRAPGRRRRRTFERGLLSTEGEGSKVTAEDLTDEGIREVRDRVMGGSPLSEDTLVATGDLVLDDGDPEVNIADARDRIAAWINQRNAERCPYGNMPREAGAGHWRDWHRGHGCHLDPDAINARATTDSE